METLSEVKTVLHFYAGPLALQQRRRHPGNDRQSGRARQRTLTPICGSVTQLSAFLGHSRAGGGFHLILKLEKPGRQ